MGQEKYREMMYLTSKKKKIAILMPMDYFYQKANDKYQLFVRIGKTESHDKLDGIKTHRDAWMAQLVQCQISV